MSLAVMNDKSTPVAGARRAGSTFLYKPGLVGVIKDILGFESSHDFAKGTVNEMDSFQKLGCEVQ